MLDNEIVVDLADAMIKGYINRGFGVEQYGVSQSEAGLVFEESYEGSEVFPMYAVDFSEYLACENVSVEDVERIEMVASVYDDASDEVDLSLEFQKCAFVSQDALDGYSASDILPSGNYKAIGSRETTKFDLTKYTGYTSDGQTLTEHALEDGVGINIQIVNGDYRKIRFFTITSLKFILK